MLGEQTKCREIMSRYCMHSPINDSVYTSHFSTARASRQLPVDTSSNQDPTQHSRLESIQGRCASQILCTITMLLDLSADAKEDSNLAG